MMTNEQINLCKELMWHNSEHSSCMKKKVGGVLFDTVIHAIVGDGYGGSVRDIKCEKCIRETAEWTQDGCWSIHAELRALFGHFEKYGYSNDLSSCVMFTTHGPCDQCLKYMAYFKIPLVYYDIKYKTDYTKWDGIIEVRKI